MNKVDSALNFHALFEKVLGYWPDTIDVAKLYENEDHPDLYTVSGLGVVGDSIAEELELEFDAVLVTTLSDAVTSTIRLAAWFCTEVKPASLRSDTVRENFEMRLQRVLTNPDLGWKVDDILLIKQYFLLNK